MNLPPHLLIGFLLVGCIDDSDHWRLVADATRTSDGSALESDVSGGHDALSTNDLIKADLLPEMDDGRVSLETALAFDTDETFEPDLAVPDSEPDLAVPDSEPDLAIPDSEPDSGPASDTTPALEVEAGPVNQSCESGLCAADCNDSDSCDVACRNSARCDVDCQGASDCAVDCRNHSTCNIDCRGDSDCSEAHCRDDATCVVDCRGGDCRNFKCDGRARCYLLCEDADCKCKDSRDCGGGVIACNKAPCPADD